MILSLCMKIRVALAFLEILCDFFGHSLHEFAIEARIDIFVVDSRIADLEVQLIDFRGGLS